MVHVFCCHLTFNAATSYFQWQKRDSRGGVVMNHPLIRVGLGGRETNSNFSRYNGTRGRGAEMRQFPFTSRFHFHGRSWEQLDLLIYFRPHSDCCFVTLQSDALRPKRLPPPCASDVQRPSGTCPGSAKPPPATLHIQRDRLRNCSPP